MERTQFPLGVLRAFFEALMEMERNAKKSDVAEERFWNLLGWSLRPGSGSPYDVLHIAQVWRCLLADKMFKGSASLVEQKCIALRRITSGLSKGQQLQIAAPIVNHLKPEDPAYVEKIRLLGSLEHLDPLFKAKWGDALMEKTHLHPTEIWVLGRLGARKPLYATFQSVLPREKVARWLEMLLKREDLAKWTFAVRQWTRSTGMRELDLPKALVKRARESFDLSEEFNDKEQEELVGDSLPTGLVLEV